MAQASFGSSTATHRAVPKFLSRDFRPVDRQLHRRPRSHCRSPTARPLDRVGDQPQIIIIITTINATVCHAVSASEKGKKERRSSPRPPSSRLHFRLLHGCRVVFCRRCHYTTSVRAFCRQKLPRVLGARNL